MDVPGVDGVGKNDGLNGEFGVNVAGVIVAGVDVLVTTCAGSHVTGAAPLVALLLVTSALAEKNR